MLFHTFQDKALPPDPPPAGGSQEAGVIPMIQLRLLSGGDVRTLGALFRDRHIQQTYLVPQFRQPEDADALARQMVLLSQDQSRFVRGIDLDGELIGFLNDVERDGDRIELGYLIHPSFWGKGYATSALRQAISQLFQQGWQEVCAGAFAENAASIRVMEKSGMHRLAKTDTVEYRGQVHQCVYYAISR